jgi:signal peptidase I
MTATAERLPTRGSRRRRARSGSLKVTAVIVGVPLALLAVAFAVLATLSKPVDGHSMEPALHDGERVLTAPGSAGKANRFDVVILTERGATIVKRVIALPGDRVEITGTPQDPYQVLLQEGGAGPWYRVAVPSWAGQVHGSASCCTAEGSNSGNPQVQTVPAGKFFFLGDHPDVSADSRKYGWGDLTSIAGRVGLRSWPLSAPRGIGGRPTLVPVASPEGG